MYQKFKQEDMHNVRISPELHKQAVVAAMSHNMTLNSFVENSIAQAVHAGA